MVVVCLTLTQGIYLTLVCFRRLLTFHSYWPIDLAHINQAIWNGAHGRPQYSTVLFDGWRGHFDHILMLFSPIYWVSDSIFWVFLVYCLVVVSGAIAVYLLAKKVISGEFLPVLLSVFYLTYPPLVELAVFRLKGDVLAIPFLLFAFFFYARRHFPGFVVFCVLSLLCKETVAIVMIVWGGYAFLQKRKLKWCLTPAIGGLCVLVFLVFVFSPLVAGGAYRHLHSGEFQGNIDPALIFDLSTWSFLLRRFFENFGAVSLLSPGPLLMAVPFWGASFVWQDYLQHPMRFHIFAPVFPFIFASSIYGTRRLLSMARRLRNSTRILSVFMAAVVAVTFIRSIDLYWIPEPTDEDRAIWELISEIPGEASVTAPPLVLPVLSTRPYLRSLVLKDVRRHRTGPLDVDFVLLNRNEIVWSREVSEPGLKKLDSRYFENVSTVRSSPDFELVGRRINWDLYRKHQH